MFKKLFLFVFSIILVSTLALAAPKYSIKTMTPEVRQALDGRKERFSELRSLKSSGAIGENNKGYVEAFNSGSSAQSLAAQENRDRQVIYKAIAEQNGLEGALSTIESAFAEVQHEKAEPGDKIQNEEGKWGNK